MSDARAGARLMIESAAEAEQVKAAAGFTDVIVRHLTDDHAKVLGSLARLREVREAVRGL